MRSKFKRDDTPVDPSLEATPVDESVVPNIDGLEPEVKADLIANVENLFSQQGYGEQVTRVVIEPYKMGSAFLLDTVELAE